MSFFKSFLFKLIRSIYQIRSHIANTIDIKENTCDLQFVHVNKNGDLTRKIELLWDQESLLSMFQVKNKSATRSLGFFFIQNSKYNLNGKPSDCLLYHFRLYVKWWCLKLIFQISKQTTVTVGKLTVGDKRRCFSILLIQMWIWKWNSSCFAFTPEIVKERDRN